LRRKTKHLSISVPETPLEQTDGPVMSTEPGMEKRKDEGRS